jgi:HAD superfamily hydrolase (TIGR01509 family)
MEEPIHMMIDKPFCIKAVLFDFDGTLTIPGALDFAFIKNELGCPQQQPVLEFIEGISDTQEREQAFAKLNRFENDAAINSRPNPGAEDLIRNIRSLGLVAGLITRNSLESVNVALENFEDINLSDFNIVITRDDPVAPKPSGDGILLAAHKLGIEPENILMVGDFVFDIQAGKNAGSLTVLLDVNPHVKQYEVAGDFTVSSLSEINRIIDMGVPLPQGKLPNTMLEDFLEQFIFDDGLLIIKPGVGEDIAAVDISSEEVIILKSDPITYATDAIGHYAVLVNANDIATAGAVPRWFMTTLLFPFGSTGSDIWHVMQELNRIANKHRITLCGGHTEITDAVKRPLVIGSLVGTVKKNHLIDKRNIQTGDKILLTKSIAVEGTAIIAREFESRLQTMGFNESDLIACQQLLDSISILDEAAAAAETGGVSAMHDVTEGGLATAVTELSIAANHQIKIDMDKIPVFHQTLRICGLFDISHLGLIGSGSLLICCRPDREAEIKTQIQKAGIDLTCIGEIVGAGKGVLAFDKSGPVPWPEFEVDELTRLFSIQH